MHRIQKILCTALTVFAFESSAFAQDASQGPRTLTPRALSPVEQVAPNETHPPSRQPLSGGINVTSLNEVSTEALGVLSGQHALPNQMWQGSQRSFIEPLIQALPDTPAQPYLGVLQRRLLLSAAQPPAGASAQNSLLNKRVKKLAQMGHDKDLLNLVAGIPQKDKNATIARYESDAQLYQGDFAKACAIGAAQQGQNRDIYWIKLMTFCRLLAQQVDQAQLSLSLLRDMGDNDPVYFDLMEALSNGEKGALETLTSLNALSSALIRQTNTPLPADTVKSDDTRLNRLVALSGDLESSFRAAERNMLSLATLAQNLKKAVFEPAQIENALEVSETLPAYEAQALLYQVSTQENQLSIIQTEAMAMAFEIAAKNGHSFSISRLYQPQVAKLAQSIDLLWFAPHALRAQLNAGNWGNAKQWYLMLRNAAFTDPQAALAFAKVRPLATLAGFDVATEAVQQALTSWWQAQPETPSRFEQGARLFAMVDGLGHQIADQHWLALIDGPTLAQPLSPTSGTWVKLNKAALAGRTGETVALSLVAIATKEPAKMEPTFLRDLMFAYRAVGLENEARIIAVETALRAGL